MYKLTAKHRDLKDPITLETEVRADARATEKVLKGNGFSVVTEVEVPASDRVVKFKGVD